MNNCEGCIYYEVWDNITPNCENEDINEEEVEQYFTNNVKGCSYKKVRAKDITDCDNCPLCIDENCSYPTSWYRPESPCTSWTEDMEIYKDMYDE